MTNAMETSRRTAQPLRVGDGCGEAAVEGSGEPPPERGDGEGAGDAGSRLSRRADRGWPTTTPTTSIAVKSTKGATTAVRNSWPGAGSTLVIRPIGTSAT